MLVASAARSVAVCGIDATGRPETGRAEQGKKLASGLDFSWCCSGVECILCSLLPVGSSLVGVGLPGLAAVATVAARSVATCS